MADISKILGVSVADIAKYCGQTAATIDKVNGVTWSHSAGPFGPGGEAIGDALGGGYFAGLISTTGDGNATHYLVISPKATGEIYGKKWGPTSTYTGLFDNIDGPGNTASLVALGTAYQAATWCDGLTIGGFTDWYLPALMELGVLYYYLKPATAANNTSYGSNAYAVSPQPISTNWGAGAPTQTAVADFQTVGGTNELENGIFWGSTEGGNSLAAILSATDGTLIAAGTKSLTTRWTRAIRRIAI